jgi:hypothetical protein
VTHSSLTQQITTSASSNLFKKSRNFTAFIVTVLSRNHDLNLPHSHEMDEQLVKPLKTNVHLNYISIFSSYRAVNNRLLVLKNRLYTPTDAHDRTTVCTQFKRKFLHVSATSRHPHGVSNTKEYKHKNIPVCSENHTKHKNVIFAETIF